MAEYDARAVARRRARPRIDYPDRRPAQDLLAKQVTLGVSLVTLVAAIIMSFQFKANDGFQFVQNYDWIKDFGVHYAVGVDGIGLALIDLTADPDADRASSPPGARTSSAGAASGATSPCCWRSRRS